MAKDIYHNLVRQSLENEGWKITDDPYKLYFGVGTRKVMADLGAEKWIIAEKNLQKIVVEVKSFITSSNINELHHAVGQLDFYALLLEQNEPDRIPYLAIPKDAYDELIIEPIIQLFLEKHNTKLIVFDIQQPIIHVWKN